MMKWFHKAIVPRSGGSMEVGLRAAHGAQSDEEGR